MTEIPGIDSEQRFQKERRKQFTLKGTITARSVRSCHIDVEHVHFSSLEVFMIIAL